jgi:hypothetical protein
VDDKIKDELQVPGDAGYKVSDFSNKPSTETMYENANDIELIKLIRWLSQRQGMNCSLAVAKSILAHFRADINSDL